MFPDFPPISTDGFAILAKLFGKTRQIKIWKKTELCLHSSCSAAVIKNISAINEEHCGYVRFSERT
jgi:hypothetical protein